MHEVYFVLESTVPFEGLPQQLDGYWHSFADAEYLAFWHHKLQGIISFAGCLIPPLEQSCTVAIHNEKDILHVGRYLYQASKDSIFNLKRIISVAGITHAREKILF